MDRPPTPGKLLHMAVRTISLGEDAGELRESRFELRRQRKGGIYDDEPRAVEARWIVRLADHQLDGQRLGKPEVGNLPAQRRDGLQVLDRIPQQDRAAGKAIGGVLQARNEALELSRLLVGRIDEHDAAALSSAAAAT